jgi:hypothetical protein
VQHKLGCNPPSEPHGKSACGKERHGRHNVERDSAFPLRFSGIAIARRTSSIRNAISKTRPHWIDMHLHRWPGRPLSF